ncbi:D-alanyl-D-alanine carboxypeptidase [Secundilactobacillus paracollinoides]|uniref:D-alanyl-D-alanine carboxypeptidase n=1 Tax=Secundilactobacillus paracollinoides TaxID=240427 RepID=A0A1B2IZR8_9LACO|nr:serine hydrolase [Secundilactobacillus paracollinoides]ANZ61643.1 D-alanyl-D-alanine carboxypeptidase [Secundilactobacillus paracollinoides]ANZ63282.1 D-alanyl-D-alanine carboxypeptidase [Secundilactobacillus paracollinoides]ANZ67561.1 D-alanyl-D-alanine carboxypeptidase [Secundilactobacillus paracollinoides]
MSQSRFHLRGTLLVAFALLLGFVGFVSVNQPAAHAATYSVSKTTSMTKTAYHRASTKGAVYNESHTKKLANLSSYPYTTWYATQEVILKHGSTKAIYYKVTNGAGTVTGYVWHSYLTKGKSAFGLKYAKAAVALDAKTGKVVWSKNANTPRAIASVSKLMTLYLVEQKVANTSATWSSKVTTSYSGLKTMGASSVYGGFKFTKNSYTVEQLYLAALIDSSNNAATALGQWVAGGSTPSYNAKFIKLMNAQAKTWNLGHATFVSASGVEQSALKTYGYSVSGGEANEVSAKDVALIANHLITDYPAVLTDASKGSVTVSGQLCYNYNNLLPGRKYYEKALNVDGLKTGYTDLAGYCFVGTGQKSGHDRLITVVLHDANEFTETRSLMDHVYSAGLI